MCPDESLSSRLSERRIFWELCDLVADQQMNACPTDPHEAKSTGDSLTWQVPVDLGTVQNTAVTTLPAHSLLSHNFDDSLHGF